MRNPCWYKPVTFFDSQQKRWTQVARTKNIEIETVEDASNAVVAAIGSRLRFFRQDREMTLQDLAEATDLSPSMLSLVERGRAAPSVQSLIVIANALQVTVSDLIVTDQSREERIVVRASEQPFVKTAQNVIRRVMREDRSRGVSIAINEYDPDTGSSLKRGGHTGFEYGFVLEGTLTVELESVSYQLNAGDLIAFDSKRPHRFWNNGSKRVRTLWINLKAD
jgi:transcriptional regulator with XRE-family HTH domain